VSPCSHGNHRVIASWGCELRLLV